jgi:hypothetical protein
MMGGGLGLGSSAEAATVLLLRPARPSAIVSEAIVRLRGELVAAGFGVELAEPTGDGDTPTPMTAAAIPATVDAAISLFGETPEDPGALLVINRATGKVVRHAILPETDANRAAEVLSIRALEVLRASFLEAALEGPPPPPKPAVPTKPPPVTEERRAPVSPVIATATIVAPAPPSRFALEIGGLMLGSLDGVPASILPLIRLQASVGSLFVGRLTLAGLGTRARATSPRGDADVSHQLALAEVALRFRATKTLQPFLSLGLGAIYVTAEGQASSPYQGKQGSAWAGVADVGVGLRISVSERFQLAGEFHAQGDAPYPQIRFLGAPLAEEGRPTLLGSLSVVAWM